jgi:hypothetical protein
MAELPRGTVTLVFTDIEGSTRLLASLGSRYEAVLVDHRKLLRHAFSSHAGVEVDTQGDALFYAFPRAQDAVAGAVAAQRALASHLFGEGVELRVRMGIHTGGPSLSDEFKLLARTRRREENGDQSAWAEPGRCTMRTDSSGPWSSPSPPSGRTRARWRARV